MEQYQESGYLDNQAMWQKHYGAQEAEIISKAMEEAETQDK